MKNLIIFLFLFAVYNGTSQDTYIKILPLPIPLATYVNLGIEKEIKPKITVQVMLHYFNVDSDNLFGGIYGGSFVPEFKYYSKGVSNKSFYFSSFLHFTYKETDIYKGDYRESKQLGIGMAWGGNIKITKKFHLDLSFRAKINYVDVDVVTWQYSRYNEKKIMFIPIFGLSINHKIFDKPKLLNKSEIYGDQ